MLPSFIYMLMGENISSMSTRNGNEHIIEAFYKIAQCDSKVIFAYELDVHVKLVIP